MMRKLIAATAAAALGLSTVTPALAQSASFYDQYLPDRAAVASVNLKVPLGGGEESATKPSAGLSFGYRQKVDTTTFDGLGRYREANMADLRFTSDGLEKAQVASFNFADMGQSDQIKGKAKLGAMEDGDYTLWIVLGVVVGGVLICWAAGCFGDDDDDDLND